MRSTTLFRAFLSYGSEFHVAERLFRSEVAAWKWTFWYSSQWCEELRPTYKVTSVRAELIDGKLWRIDGNVLVADDEVPR